MSEFFAEYGMFLLKSVTVVLAIGALILIAVGASMRGRGQRERGHLEVHKLNDELQQMQETLHHATLDPAARKLAEKAEHKHQKAERKAQKQAAKAARKAGGEAVAAARKRIYVLDFDGDIRASATDHLRREVSALLAEAGEGDEVVLRLESGGGMVHGYGLAASQLARIKSAGVPLTVCVDKIAASGGYMMACVADRILAAPFAILGSIGVVAQIPNVHRLLKKHDIDVEVLTAGEYKRTLTLLGENTEKGRRKFIADLEDLHGLFKTFVAEHRPQLDMARVGTGEYWFGSRAAELALVDELRSSDDYLVSACAHADVYSLRYVEKKSLPERLGVNTRQAVDGALDRLLERLAQQRYDI